MSDIAWIQLKNIVLIICACASVYYISGWMIFMMMFYTIVSDNKDIEERTV